MLRIHGPHFSLLLAGCFSFSLGCGADSISDDSEPDAAVWVVEDEDDRRVPSMDPAPTPAETDSMQDDPSATCLDVVDVLTVPSRAIGVLPAGVGDVDEVSCAGVVSGREVHYELVIERRMPVRIYTRWVDQETAFSPVLTLHEGCGAESREVACSSPIGHNPEEMSGYFQRWLDPGRYRLVLDERNLLDHGEGGAYTIHIEEPKMHPFTQCEAAEMLHPDRPPHSESDVALDGITGASDSCLTNGYNLLYFLVEVPAFHTARVVGTHPLKDETHRPSLRAADSCDVGRDACQLSGSSQGELVLSNPSRESKEFYVAVGNHYVTPLTLFLELQPL